jgi:putative ABC transport system ATP-binding protein
MKPSIKLEGVSRIYTMGEIDVVALNDVSFEIPPGEFLVLLGPSGSGKTTLLNLIGGLDTPSFGRIGVNGFEVSRMNRSQLTQYRRTQVGFIFQTFNLIPTLTAKENVEFAADLVKNHPSVEKLMESVGLGHRLNHFPSELSGGENQRVAIARALATDPSIMLCDEPTGSLDFETGKRIFKLLRELNKTQQKTVVVVTHNAPVGEIADRVLKLRDGRIAETITNEHPLDPDKLEW